MAEQVTVLLVEDEPSFVEALVVGLKREGFRVDVAYDGAEALDKFASVQPDLVLAGRDVASRFRYRCLPQHPRRGRSHTDHHGHGQDERDRYGGRARGRSRRLRQQAVPAA